MSDTTNTTITQKEEDILQNIGFNVLTDVAKLTNFTFFYGAFLVVFFISLHMIMRRGLKTRAAWAIFIGTFLNFALETAKWIMLLTHLIFEIQIFFLNNGNLSLKDRWPLENRNDALMLNPIEDFEQIPILISDAFVIWRAWALFSDRKLMMPIPLTLFFATVVTYVVGNSFSLKNADVDDTLFLVNLSLSFATNFITTLMIGWRLWTYRKHVAPNIGASSSRVQRTFVMLVESGAVFCVLQLATLINHVRPYNSGNGSDGISDGAMQQILFSSAAMYPSIIAILAHTNSSQIDDVSTISSMKGPKRSQVEFLQWEVEPHSTRSSICYKAAKPLSNNGNGVV